MSGSMNACLSGFSVGLLWLPGVFFNSTKCGLVVGLSVSVVSGAVRVLTPLRLQDDFAKTVETWAGKNYYDFGQDLHALPYWTCFVSTP